MLFNALSALISLTPTGTTLGGSTPCSYWFMDDWIESPSWQSTPLLCRVQLTSLQSSLYHGASFVAGEMSYAHLNDLGSL
jgi:hypothetical protein